MSIHTPLHTEFRLEHPGLDEVREFTSLIVRIRDENDVGINVEFPRALLYSKTDETYALDSLNEIFGSGGSDHWLYEVVRSRVLEDFKRRNPHHMGPHWNPRHYLVVTDDEVIDVIALSRRRDHGSKVRSGRLILRSPRPPTGRQVRMGILTRRSTRDTGLMAAILGAAALGIDMGPSGSGYRRFKGPIELEMESKSRAKGDLRRRRGILPTPQRRGVPIAAPSRARVPYMSIACFRRLFEFGRSCVVA